MRGLGTCERGITVEGGAIDCAEATQSVSLQVEFDFNSAGLTNDARITLENLGRALDDAALRDFRFRVAGNTDAVGSDAYNQDLSERRARAVVAFLHEHYRIGGERLTPIGYGKRHLLDLQDPRAAINRRVEVTNLSGAAQP
jgi:outer membrane protein OmpA-like peptidoglycan-associated protein